MPQRWQAPEPCRAREAEIAEEKRKADAEQLAAHDAAASDAARLWDKSDPTDPTHPYLLAKAVRPHGLRQHGDLLLVPLRDIGGRVAGLFSPIGDLAAPVRLVICEGWATGSTLHEETGLPVLAAMNAGNLKPVAQAARCQSLGADIIIAADNDRNTKGNPGLTAAREATSAIAGRLAVPMFLEGVAGTDFNDLHRALRQAGNALGRDTSA